MYDMTGQKWVYHIPVLTFGLLLQNRSMQGKSSTKEIGYDQLSQTHWITTNQPQEKPAQKESFEDPPQAGSFQMNSFQLGPQTEDPFQDIPEVEAPNPFKALDEVYVKK